MDNHAVAINQSVDRRVSLPLKDHVPSSSRVICSETFPHTQCKSDRPAFLSPKRKLTRVRTWETCPYTPLIKRGDGGTRWLLLTDETSRGRQSRWRDWAKKMRWSSFFFTWDHLCCLFCTVRELTRQLKDAHSLAIAMKQKLFCFLFVGVPTSEWQKGKGEAMHPSQHAVPRIEKEKKKENAVPRLPTRLNFWRKKSLYFFFLVVIWRKFWMF